MNAHAARVLNYWWALEMFISREIPKLESAPYTELAREGKQRTSDWSQADDSFPWESTTVLPRPHPRKNGMKVTEYVWAHRVYLGIYDNSRAYSMLSELFGEDWEPGERKGQGEGAVALIPVSSNGKIRLGKVVLSSMIWAAARVSPSSPDNFGSPRDFAEAQKRVNEEIRAYELSRIRSWLKIDRTGGEFQNDNELLAHQLPVTRNTFNDILAIITGVLGTGPYWQPQTDGRGKDSKGLYSDRVRITSYQVPKATQENSESSDTDIDNFINSFHLHDLGSIFLRVSSGEITPALKTYLAEKAEPSQGDRVDLLANPHRADDLLDPRYIPAGRWPSNPAYSLARAQQFTVNRLLKHHRERGQVLGVNGPPGTGKTTMLRDVIAALVTERADKLSQLDNPAEAFKKEGIPYTYRGEQKIFNPLIDALTGYEMVLVSSNNSAVENISTEIPDRQASTDSGSWPDADYFSDLASLLLQETKDPYGKTGEFFDAWGAVSARFGASKNRFTYMWHLLYGGTLRLKDEAGRRHTEKLEGLGDLLKDPAGPEEWQQARQAFIRARQRVEQIRQECVRANQRREKLADTIRRLGLLEEKDRGDRRELDLVRDSYQLSIREVSASEEQYSEARDRHDRQRELKPGWWENLRSFGALRAQWREELQRLSTVVDATQQLHRKAREGLRQWEERCQKLEKLVEQQHVKLVDLRQRVDQYRSAVKEDRRVFGDFYPDQDDERQRELFAPWLTEDFNRARSDLFLAALDLHRAFIYDSRTHMRPKILCANSVVTNSAESPSPQLRRAAWQVFFMVVPTISSTFASVSNMFTGLGRESLGWLLVDEAGQSNPQEVVGALWRTQNMLAVGDPLQLQPITNVPDKARKYMADYYRLPEDWMPLPASLQTVVDRVAHYGAYLGQDDDRRWVSAPLRVHRRCESPMFEISNRVAYDGMMISATVPSEGWHSPGAQVYRSLWRNTEFSNPDGKVQESDFQVFADLMTYLEKVGVSPSEVIAISPFRDISARLKKLRGKYPGLRAGTVHTAQGREAPVVVLVLGTAESADGSRRWAASTPHLVNVAASRAKRRLYVLGNIGKWGSLPYFNTMLSELGKGQTRQGS